MSIPADYRVSGAPKRRKSIEPSLSPDAKKLRESDRKIVGTVSKYTTPAVAQAKKAVTLVKRGDVDGANKALAAAAQSAEAAQQALEKAALLKPRIKEKLPRGRKRLSMQGLYDVRTKVRNTNKSVAHAYGKVATLNKAVADYKAAAATAEAQRKQAAVALYKANAAAASRAQSAPAGYPIASSGAGALSIEQWKSITREAAPIAGVPTSWADSSALASLVSKESGFNPNAQNVSSTAYGLGQFLNSTWASTGVAKTSDPKMQMVGMLRYVRDRYGSPENALSYHLQNNHY